MQGEGIAAGLHIHDAATGGWNVPAAACAAEGLDAVLIWFAMRRRGLLFRADGAALSDLSDVAGRRVVRRQPESGTDALFRELAVRHGLDPSGLDYSQIARTEDDAAETVRRGEADLAFRLEAAGADPWPGFVPVVEENYELLVDRRAWFEPQMQGLADFWASATVRSRAATCEGDDFAQVGAVLWNA